MPTDPPLHREHRDHGLRGLFTIPRISLRRFGIPSAPMVRELSGDIKIIDTAVKEADDILEDEAGTVWVVEFEGGSGNAARLIRHYAPQVKCRLTMTWPLSVSSTHTPGPRRLALGPAPPLPPGQAARGSGQRGGGWGDQNSSARRGHRPAVVWRCRARSGPGPGPPLFHLTAEGRDQFVRQVEPPLPDICGHPHRIPHSAP